MVQRLVRSPAAGAIWETLVFAQLRSRENVAPDGLAAYSSGVTGHAK